MGREFEQIPVSVFWSKTSFSDFYEITKNSISSFKANQYEDNSVPTQYASHESKICRTYPGHVIDISKRERVFWSDNQLKVNECKFATEKVVDIQSNCAQLLTSPTNSNNEVNLTHWKDVFHNTGCCTGEKLFLNMNWSCSLAAFEDSANVYFGSPPRK